MNDEGSSRFWVKKSPGKSREEEEKLFFGKIRIYMRKNEGPKDFFFKSSYPFAQRARSANENGPRQPRSDR